MKVTISQIENHDFKLKLDVRQIWISEMISEAFINENPILDKCYGEVTIQSYDENVSFKGSVHIFIKPICSLCLEEYDYQMDIPIVMHLIPHFKDDLHSDEKNIELSQDDLDFSFHNGKDLDLKEIIREQLVLAMPVNFVCHPDCLGLCPQCGINLNHDSCQCAEKKPVDPRLEILKKFKPKS